MREIKFRAWDNLNKEMYYLDAPRLDANLGTVRFDAHRPFSEQFWLMQFTGLLDKSGKEIYEGDILVSVDAWENRIHSSVVWNTINGAWEIGGCANRSSRIFEIIGNIHEHPALLGDSGGVK